MEHISTQETLAPDYYILFTFLLGTLLTQVIFQQLWYTITAKKHAALPGPLGFPVLGCLPFTTTQNPELTLDYWAKRHGSLYKLWLGNQRFVILSDETVVKDLLVDHGKIFSSRKSYFIKSQTILAGRAITATPYNDLLFKHRRVMQKWLTKAAVDRYMADIANEGTRLIRRICTQAKMGSSGPATIDPFFAIDRYVANNILKIVFGCSENLVKPLEYERILELVWEFMECTDPMSNIVDFIPLLQKLPNKTTKRAKRLHQGLVETLGGIMDEIQKHLQSGKHVSGCFASSLIENQEKEKYDRLDMIMLCAAFIIPGFGSVTSLLRAFVSVIAQHPEIQTKAQKELDRVVGRDRLPNLDDEGNLHYVRSIIKEVERLYNPLPLGTPHFNTEDFAYRGLLIPKETVIVINNYTIHRDPTKYPEPNLFKPERYLEGTSPSQSGNQCPSVPEHLMFGAGRRSCPGMHLAEREIFLGVSYILWAFSTEVVASKLTDDISSFTGRGIRMHPRHEKVVEVLGREEIS